jgi:hypothetical protein
MRDYNANMNAFMVGHLGLGNEPKASTEPTEGEKGKEKSVGGAADKPAEGPGTIPLPNYDSSSSRMNYLSQWQKKYGPLEGRGDHVLKVNEIPRGAKDTAKNISEKVGKQFGIDPALLYSSSMEEGMSGLFKDKSGKDTKNRKEGEFGYQDFYYDKEYPISGQQSFGLNTFADRFPDLVKDGYLPKEFEKKFRGEKNEKSGENLMRNDFVDAESALKAKAALLKYTYDDVEKYAKSKGITLTDKAKDFFALASYNGGEGGFRKLLKEYKEKGLLDDDKFLKERPNKGKIPEYQDIYGHVMKRIKMANALKKEKLF